MALPETDAEPETLPRGKAERLSREDAARWYMGTAKNPMVIGALLLFDERLSVEALEEVIRGKLVQHGRFHQHVVEPERRFGRPSWRDDVGFEVRDHVQKLSPPEPVDGDVLRRLAGDRMGAPLPRDRSPWMMELVDLTGGGSALIARFHHCIADGRALVSMLADLADGPASETAAASLRPRAPAPRAPGGVWAWLTSLARFFTLRPDPAGELRRGLTGKKRVAWSLSIPMASVKSIARATDHHVADVLLAAVAGALGRHARARGEAPRSLHALLPIAAPSNDSHARLGNHFASVFVRLPIVAPTPRARLESIARDLAVARRGGVLAMAIALMRLAGTAAPALERWAVRRWARRASLVVSSLAGPPVPVRFAGQPIRSIVVWAPAAASIGLSLTFFGYGETLSLGVLADDAVIERPEELVTEVRAALDELGRGALPCSP